MPRDKILLVEADSNVLQMLIDAFIRRFRCEITVVPSAADAMDVEMLEPHTLVVADLDAAGMRAPSFVDALKDLSDRPVILMGQEPSAAEAIAMMRGMATDYFIKPFELETLLASMERAMQRHREACVLRRRYRQVRSTLRRCIRRRRALDERLDLVCRDLVGAHKRLVQRVLRVEGSADGSEFQRSNL